MNDSIKNIESTQTDYNYDDNQEANCAVTPSNSMAFAKEANYIKNASDVEFAKEDEVYTAYSPDLTF